LLPAVILDGQLHLFDPRLGLPLRGPDGHGVATLEQLQQDDRLLRRLDLPDLPYPVNAEKLEQLTANIVADEVDLSRAAFQLERKLTGDNRVVLWANASETAGRVKSLRGIREVRLWDVPFRTLSGQLNLGLDDCLNAALAFEPFAWRPAMWKARVLHFQGRRRGTGDVRTNSAAEAVDSHAEATEMYFSRDDTKKAVRPSLRDPAWVAPDKQRVAVALRLNAAYWGGLLHFDKGRYEIARQWFRREELLKADSPWSAGANYNLARTYEALGKREEAIKLYEADTSAQRHGNRLRAKGLKAEAGGE
jgi:tetratricopeptide (TPR) repeat protein